MAPGIAAACLTAASHVVIAARNETTAAEAARVATELGAGRVTAAPLEVATFAHADLAIETIVEDLSAKTELLERVEEWLPSSALLVTNTSSIRVDDLARGLSRPGRFAGLHFLHPAQETRVVELIPGAATDGDTRERLAEFARRMGKQPILVRRDIAGFVWNRLQFAILRECLHLVQDGIADIASVDAAVSDGLAPRWLACGPLATADLGGLGTFHRVAERIFPVLANDADVSDALARRAAEGGGFYRWAESETTAIETLRDETLSAVRRVSERRRATMPPADDRPQSSSGHDGLHSERSPR